MPTTTRTFRVFVSSTFEDLKAERDALQRHVFPRLRRLCEANNARFQAIDLRWGVRDEAALDQQTLEICLREIERCQQTGIKPNFIVLLGERYGWRPLPARIEAGEFERILSVVAQDEKKLLLCEKNQPAAGRGWYCLDLNAAPAEYILRPRELNVAADAPEKEKQAAREQEARAWKAAEDDLREIFRSAIARLGWPVDDPRRVKYEASATHQEILKGLGQSEEDRQHVFAFFRTPAEGTTEDPDLTVLKDELREKLPAENVRPFSFLEIEKLCAEVEASLSAVILAETGKFTSRPALDLEMEAHDKFALHRVRHFTGRQSVLDEIGRHIRGGESRPLVVHGASGCGKSAIMAKAAGLARAAVPGAVLIQRFIGVTPDSSGGVSLLSSLCQQLSREYRVTEETPMGFQPLVAAFHERMARATAEQPLVIFLDALDQLRSDDEASSFTWLHQNLPEHVSFIVTTTEIPAGLTGTAKTLVEDFPADAADEVLTAWLADAKRELQPEQRQKVLSAFVQSESMLPLYLKLAFEEARRWRSFQPLEGCALGDDVGGMIDVLFDRLSEEANHGPTLVERSLGYLAAARYGLTEDEMLDVLASDDAVWSDFDKRKHHDVSERSLPVVVWSRLSLDLEAYFTERAAPGGNVISFFHRQLAEQVAMRFLAGDESQARHADLARHFCAKPAWLDEGGKTPSKRRPAELAPQRKTPNARRAAELVFQQRGARQWAEAEATLFDCPFLFAKVAAGLVLDLDDDYRALLQDAPESGLPRRDMLRLLQGTLRLSLHVVAENPGQFASQMRGRLLAHQDKASIATFLENLDACTSRPRLRPQWPTLEAAGGPMLRVLEGHTGGVRAVALSADGKRAVSGSIDGTVRVWDLEGNQPPRVLEGHTDWVFAVALSADGRRAVSGSADNTLRIWYLEGEQSPRILEGHTDKVYAVALSADGNCAVSGSADHTLRVWDLEGNKPPLILNGYTREISAVALSAEGRRVVFGSDDYTVRVWDLEGNEPPRILEGNMDWFNAVLTLATDGKRAVSGSRDSMLRVWDLEGNEPPRVLEGHTVMVNAVALTADGKYAISGSCDKTLRVWNLEGNQPPRILEGHTDWVNAVAISADGKRVVSGSSDNTLRVWDLEGNEAPRDLEGHTKSVNAVSLSADGMRAVSGSQDHTLRVWDIEGSQLPRVLEGHTAGVNSVALTADGKRAVSCSYDKTIQVWEVEGDQAPQILERHTDRVSVVALSADGKRAVTSSSDNTLRVWDIEGNETPRDLEGHTDRVTAVAISADGKRAVSSSEDKTLRVWDLEGSQLPRILEGHTDQVDAVALSDDGQLVVFGSDDKTIRICDLEGNQPLRFLEGHTGAVRAMALSGNGRRAISGSWDKTLRVWDIESGNCLAVFTCDAQVYTCAWARDRNRIVAGDESGKVHLFAWEE
jgi:WD40 repeat protein